jgi:hypothetical protein
MLIPVTSASMQGEKETLLFNSLGATRWIVRPYNSSSSIAQTVTAAGVSHKSVAQPSPPTSPKSQNTTKTGTDNSTNDRTSNSAGGASPRSNGRGWGFRRQRRGSLPMVRTCVLQ